MTMTPPRATAVRATSASTASAPAGTAGLSTAYGPMTRAPVEHLHPRSGTDERRGPGAAQGSVMHRSEEHAGVGGPRDSARRAARDEARCEAKRAVAREPTWRSGREPQ